MTITQRQAESGDQHESIGFACAQCQEPLFIHEFAVQDDDVGPVRVLDTIGGALEAAEAYNCDAGLRVCANCGLENAPFPEHHWGWRQYVSNSKVTGNAFEQLNSAAREAK